MERAVLFSIQVGHGRHTHFVEVRDMLVTYLILKLTFQSILNEVNRLAVEQESKEKIRLLKSRLLKINLDHAKGSIDDKMFEAMQAELLNDLRSYPNEHN